MLKFSIFKVKVSKITKKKIPNNDYFLNFLSVFFSPFRNMYTWNIV